MTESNSRIETLKSFLAADPNDDFSEYALALEYEKENNRKEGLKHLSNVLHRNPGYLAAYYQAGRMSEAEKDVVAAVKYYEEGMQLSRQLGNIKTYNELRSALEMMD